MALDDEIARVKIYKSMSEKKVYYALEVNGQPGFLAGSIEDLVLTSGNLLLKADLNIDSVGKKAEGHLEVRILDKSDVLVLNKSIRKYEQGINSLNANAYKKLV